ncbi:HD domain-containing protein [Heliobacterium chlorum]|uniref:HD domain-containing protein n=1 Tax=Heliobacterium chlorum TaxID=2698 RepID=A0ABR7T604_HELCL|nr:HD domain-containing protein [Heliobacterium chlorum]
MALDLSNEGLSYHHKRVAYIAVSIGKAMNLPCKKLLDLYCSSSIHDIGAVTFEERKNLLNFDVLTTDEHCERGYRILKDVHHFENISKIILHHHERWDKRKENHSQELLLRHYSSSRSN